MEGPKIAAIEIGPEGAVLPHYESLMCRDLAAAALSLRTAVPLADNRRYILDWDKGTGVTTRQVVAHHFGLTIKSGHQSNPGMPGEEIDDAPWTFTLQDGEAEPATRHECTITFHDMKEADTPSIQAKATELIDGYDALIVHVSGAAPVRPLTGVPRTMLIAEIAAQLGQRRSRFGFRKDSRCLARVVVMLGDVGYRLTPPPRDRAHLVPLQMGLDPELVEATCVEDVISVDPDLVKLLSFLENTDLERFVVPVCFAGFIMNMGSLNAWNGENPPRMMLADALYRDPILREAGITIPDPMTHTFAYEALEKLCQYWGPYNLGAPLIVAATGKDTALSYDL